MNIFERILSKKLKVAFIDDSKITLTCFSAMYRQFDNRLIFDTFHYPNDISYLKSRVNLYQMILIDHYLGKENGSDLARDFFKRGYKGSLIIISENTESQYLPFRSYYNKASLRDKPDMIFDIYYQHQDQVDFVIESSVLSTIGPQSRDIPEMEYA